MFEYLGRKFLQQLNPETAHDLSIKLLSSPFSRLACNKTKENPVEFFGLKFPNPVGLAAGFDKNADALKGLSHMGFGFLEVGTVTPKPQNGNPKPRLFRLKNNQAIINRMGFNNKGVDYLVKQVKKYRPDCILGINIGKNKVTPNESAIKDYLYCFDKVHKHADYVTINISSPNTENLRQLQDADNLIKLLKSIKEAQLKHSDSCGKYTPVLVKIAPDQKDETTIEIARNIMSSGMDGIICTNTTVSRNNLSQEENLQQQGGLSGKPLLEKSNKIISLVRSTVGKSFPIIGVGGILTDEDAMSKIHSGADLLQIYTGLVYQGPELINSINNKIASEIQRNNIT